MKNLRIAFVAALLIGSATPVFAGDEDPLVTMALRGIGVSTGQAKSSTQLSMEFTKQLEQWKQAEEKARRESDERFYKELRRPATRDAVELNPLNGIYRELQGIRGHLENVVPYGR
jgi:hypothetical protein